MRPLSDHFDGIRFFNPGGGNGRSFSDLPKMVSEKRTPWPRSVPVEPRHPERRPEHAWATVTFVGHATFFIQTSSGNLITDPVFSERASPLHFIGPRRVREPGVRLEDLPHVDAILLSHNHYDHCDLASLRTIRHRHNPRLVTSLGNGRQARRAGFKRIEELDWWETTTSPLPVTVTPAQHFSARTPFDRNRALWCGFIIEVGARRVFFAGDSGYGPHFAEIGRRCGACDLALLPIGAYEPRWFMGDIHMNPREAVQAHQDLGSKLSLAMHFGTFQLTTEGIDEPLLALSQALDDQQIHRNRFRALDFGASAHFTDATSNS